IFVFFLRGRKRVSGLSKLAAARSLENSRAWGSLASVSDGLVIVSMKAVRPDEVAQNVFASFRWLPFVPAPLYFSSFKRGTRRERIRRLEKEGRGTIFPFRPSMIVFCVRRGGTLGRASRSHCSSLATPSRTLTLGDQP